MDPVRCIFIPCKDSLHDHPYPTPIQLTVGDIEGYCNFLEELLGSVPNLQLMDPHPFFSWDHRSLFWLRSDDEGIQGFGKNDYLMYLCLDEEAGLPLNEKITEYLHSDCDIDPKDSAVSTVKVYGDVFIFAMLGHGFNKKGEVPFYSTLNRYFTDSLMGGEDDSARIIVRKILDPTFNSSLKDDKVTLTLKDDEEYMKTVKEGADRRTEYLSQGKYRY